MTYHIHYKASDDAMNVKEVTFEEIDSTITEIEQQGGAIWSITDKDSRLIRHADING